MSMVTFSWPQPVTGPFRRALGLISPSSLTPNQAPNSEALVSARRGVFAVETSVAQRPGILAEVPDVDDQHASADLQHPRDLAHGSLAFAGVVDVVQSHAGEHDVEAGIVERQLACVGGLHLDA